MKSMPSSFIIRLAFIFAVAAARAEMPAQPADRFADSIGVCTHWTYPDTPYGFAFVRHDLSPKPAFHALRRLLALTAEPNARADFQTTPLPGDLEVKPAKGFDRVQYVHHLALQRSDGTFLLLVWHDIALDDTSKKPWRRVPLAPPMPTTLKLTKPVKHAEVFIPNDCDEIVQTFTNTDTLPFAVPDRVMVVRLRF